MGSCVYPALRGIKRFLFGATGGAIEEVVVARLGVRGNGVGGVGGDRILTLGRRMDYRGNRIMDGALMRGGTMDIALFTFSGSRRVDARRSRNSTFIAYLSKINGVAVSNIRRVLGRNRSVIVPTGRPRTMCNERRFGVLLIIMFWVFAASGFGGVPGGASDVVSTTSVQGVSLNGFRCGCTPERQFRLFLFRRVNDRCGCCYALREGGS